MGLAKKILNLCGYEIWPPTHGDPRIKGPQPRIITKLGFVSRNTTSTVGICYNIYRSYVRGFA